MGLDSIKREIKDCYWMAFERQKEKNILSGERIKKGKHIYYVILHNRNVGLFSYVEVTLRQVAYALENGYIPVVDMQTYPNAYLRPDQLAGGLNSWEFYFEQPCHGNLSQVYENEEYLLSKEENRSAIPYAREWILSRHSRYFWSEMYRKYLRFNEKTAKYIEKECNEILKGEPETVLGVLVRGTDYHGAVGHPIQPKVEEVICKVKDYMAGKGKGQYKSIYLATEEKSVVELFEQEFPDRILVNQRTYFDEFSFQNQTINDVEMDREDDRYLRGLEYLSSIKILSLCGGFVGGLCGGTYASIYMNCDRGKIRYKDVHLFCCGIQK